MDSVFSYLTLFASACATAAFMLTLAHLTLWLRGLRRAEHALASLMTFGVGCVALLELALILSNDIATAEFRLRQYHFALFVSVMSLIAFVHVYLKDQRRWLIFVIAVLWLVTFVADVLNSGSILHTRITGLRQLQAFWGEAYSLPVGLTNPWKYLTDVASLLMLVYLLQASHFAWRFGQRRRALLVGGGSVTFILLAGVLVPLQDAGYVAVPLLTSIAFLLIVVALATQLIDDAFSASESMLEVEKLRRAMTLGEMVGGLAHEINQPLSAILSNAQAAARFLNNDNVDIEEIREIIDDIIVDEKRASGVIRGLRQMLERQTPETTAVDVNASARTAASIVSGEFHVRDATLTLDLDPAAGPTLADSMQLQQVLINLLLNAVRATGSLPRQQRYVVIRTLGLDDVVEVSVLDRGPGVEEQMKAKVFEPFVTNSDEGLGIGLVVCKRIIERYGGKIWIEDREGGGAAIRFTLPCADDSG